MWSLYLGRRRGYGTQKLAYRPHSVSHVVLGTALIWFGWYVPSLSCFLFCPRLIVLCTQVRFQRRQ